MGRDLRKSTLLPESTLNFAYITHKNSFLLKSALKTKLCSIKGPTDNEFDEAFCNVLYIHVPHQVKILRHNNSAFITKSK